MHDGILTIERQDSRRLFVPSMRHLSSLAPQPVCSQLSIVPPTDNRREVEPRAPMEGPVLCAVVVDVAVPLDAALIDRHSYSHRSTE